MEKWGYYWISLVDGWQKPMGSWQGLEGINKVCKEPKNLRSAIANSTLEAFVHEELESVSMA